MQIEFAHDVLARRLRNEAEARFDTIRSRADLRECARLHALADYIEADADTAGLFGLLTPSFGAREFPSPETVALVEQWAAEPTCDLPTLVQMLVGAELDAALRVERALL
jgi:hypothetical protein